MAHPRLAERAEQRLVSLREEPTDEHDGGARRRLGQRGRGRGCEGVRATEGQRRAEGQQRAAERVEPRREVPTHTPAERAHRVAVGEEQGAVQAGRQIRERRLPQRGELAPARGARLR